MDVSLIDMWGQMGLFAKGVVVVMAIVSAMILGLFDFVWSKLTELVYG